MPTKKGEERLRYERPWRMLKKPLLQDFLQVGIKTLDVMLGGKKKKIINPTFQLCLISPFLWPTSGSSFQLTAVPFSCFVSPWAADPLLSLPVGTQSPPSWLAIANTAYLGF